MLNNANPLEIYREIIKDEKFREIYSDYFLDRFVYSIADVEKNSDIEKRKKMIDALLKAYRLAMGYKDQVLSAIEMQKIANIVNEEAGLEGFRKINVEPGPKANWIVTPPNRIYMEIYTLINNYYNVWSGMEDVFEKEAMYHITLMRIHPFEDGNKRVSRLILNVNLINQGYPPVIISESETDDYYNFINNFDVQGFAKFLRIKSYYESMGIAFLYKSYKEIPINESIEEYLQNKENARDLS